MSQVKVKPFVNRILWFLHQQVLLPLPTKLAVR